MVSCELLKRAKKLAERRGQPLMVLPEDIKSKCRVCDGVNCHIALKADIEPDPRDAVQTKALFSLEMKSQGEERVTQFNSKVHKGEMLVWGDKLQV